jgi:hypothetical protein
MYSTFLRQQDFPSPQSIPSSSKKHLQNIEKCAYRLLETALALGHTFIITNARKGWVEDSATLYLPILIPLLQKVCIISARDTQEAKGDISQWKVRAFLEMGQQLDPRTITNLVSIGDSNMEHDAARVLGKGFPSSFTKTVKLQEYPSPEDLSKELEFLTTNLQDVVHKAGNFCAKLEKKY